MFNYLREDLRRYPRGRGRYAFLKCYWLHLGFRYTFWLRLSQFLRNVQLEKMLRPVAVIFLRHLAHQSGIQIGLGTTIGPGIYIPHHGTIVVNPNVVIGKNCYLSHNVLIGKVHAGKRQGVPVIGDDVFIGAGAVILGNIKVGNNAAIGVNSVVFEDVPDNCMVAGAPAKVVSNRGAREILGLENGGECNDD